MKKLLSIILAIMMIAIVGAAFAAQNLTNGEVGGYTSPDTQNVDDKVVNIKKEIKVYNKDESMVYGPQITYTFTVEPGSVGVSITDATTDHTPNTSVSTTTLAGITTGLKVNNGNAGSASSATGSLVWNNTDVLDAGDDGVANYKNLPLDFTDVVFNRAGVYRYKITEDSTTYAASGVTETTGSNIRYLDVYVMRSENFAPLSDTKSEYVKNDWRIYGYVCVYDDTKAIVDGDTNHAVKTNGFVSGTTDGTTAFEPDRYFTYNIEVGKTLSGDNTMTTHQFPFNVAFTNTTATGTFQLIAEKTGNATITTSAETGTQAVNGTPITANSLLKVGRAAALSAFNNAGSPTIAHEGKIKYIGIPAGTQVQIYETNDVVGTTYESKYKVDAAEYTGIKNITTTEVSNTASLAATTVGVDDNTAHAIDFTNTLKLISPTGYVSRFAPYALILVAGIALLIVAKKRKPAKDDEE